MDKKELQPVTPGELTAPAQTTVNQYGDKSVHIDTVSGKGGVFCGGGCSSAA